MTESRNAVTFRVADWAADRDIVLELRDSVYVRDQNRLSAVTDTAATFDKYDAFAIYILAEDSSGPVGTIKIIQDSHVGLPVDATADISGLRDGGPVVEFGHLMTLPRARSRSIGKGLMREALIYSVREWGATHVVGDFFADGDGKLRSFYLDIGFFVIGSPYRDTRFNGAPQSVVAALDLLDAARRARTSAGRSSEPLQYFFHDFDHYSRRA